MKIQIKTGTQKVKDGYCTWFKIDNQTFRLQTVETKREAIWYSKMLSVAFGKMCSIENIQCWLHEEEEKVMKKSKSVFGDLDFYDRSVLENGIQFSFNSLQFKTHKGKI